MKRLILLLTILCVILSPAADLIAGDKEAEVKALVERGVAMVVKQGKDATLKAIADLKGPFVKGDLYLFAISMNNVSLASGSPVDKPFNGKDISHFNFISAMTKIAKTKGSGWHEYSWPKPGEKSPSPKKTYVMRVPDQDFYIGCGYYLK